MNKLILFLLLNNLIIAQTGKDSLSVDQKSGWLAFPFVSYTPETEWAFGAAALFYFRTQSNNFVDSRASNIITAAQYTTKKQIMIELDYDLYFLNDDYRFYGYVSYNKFPSSFFGVGNFTNKEDEEVYTPKYFYIKNTFTKRLIAKNMGGLYVGLRQEFRYDKIVESEPDGTINTSQLTGSKGGNVSGLGINAIFDSRDNTFSCSEGKYAEAQLNYFSKILFSDYNFTSLLIDIRNYKSFTVFDSQTTVALQLSTTFTKGNVPFYILPTIGGSENMRGIYQGRYRDNNSYFLQGEYRFHVYWIVGMTSFAGVGQVAKDIADYSLNGLKVAYGFGVRLNVIPDEKIFLRADFGFSKEGSQIYLGFGEAF